MDEAAAAQAKHGMTLTGPTAVSVDLAERLVSLRPGAEWSVAPPSLVYPATPSHPSLSMRCGPCERRHVFLSLFALVSLLPLSGMEDHPSDSACPRRVILGKNGSDVTTAAARAARAATGRNKLLRAMDNPVKGVAEIAPSAAAALQGWAYHGATSGWLGSKPGVLTAESTAHEIGYRYNDLESVRAALDAADGDCAAIFVGGCSYPYSGPTELPTADFARGIRQMADDHGALLVLDEIRTNFRVGRGIGPGHWAELVDEVAPEAAAGLSAGSKAEAGGGGLATAFAPDMHCLCKALANGHPLAALVGNAAARDGAGVITASGTYWLSAPPMAAALATLDILEADDHAAIRHMQAMGSRLAQGLRAQAAARGIEVTVSGPAALPFMTFAVDDPRPNERTVGRAWCAAAADGGVWLHPDHNWYLTAAHTPADVDETLAATELAFDAVIPLIDRDL